MTLITFQDGAVVFRDGAVGTEQSCCCAGEPCCCVGDSAIGYDENLDPTGAECLDIQELGAGESCDGQPISKPATPASPSQCTDTLIVVEWCDLTVSYECINATVNMSDSEIAATFPSPPGICTAGGVEIAKKEIFVNHSSRVGNPLSLSFSDCNFGCYQVCNRCVIRFAVFVAEDPFQGAARSRMFYVTLREGCEDNPLIEQVYSQGVYCCSDDPVVTITIAP